MATVLEQLAEFIADSEKSYTRSQWLADDTMKVYVRKGYHLLSPGKAAYCLDIANVTVGEDKQGQGVWTEFLDKAHEMHPWEATYVECVHNPFLSASLLKHGWFPAPGQFTESYFMPKDTAKYFEQQYLKQKYGL